MSRLIDRLDRPKTVRPIQVAGIGMSRSGTLALHRALTILGFRSYHMSQAIINGEKDLRILSEACAASWDGKGKPFTRIEFDKWYAEYDAIVEIPSFFTNEFVAAYPEAKYILTERDPDSWVASWKATIGVADRDTRSLARRVFKHFDGFLYWLSRSMEPMVDRWTGGKGTSAEGYAFSRQYYIDHVERVKAVVPPAQLLCLQIEDGLDWDKICPFLGVPVPDAKWPSKHEANEFAKGVAYVTNPAVTRALVRLTVTISLSVAAVAIGVWYLVHYR